MLDMNNLRKEKHEDLCKILDFVLVALFAVFFILSLFPYYSVSKGDYITSKGYGAEGSEIEVKAGEDDSWSLLGFIGFPYHHDSVADWQADMYKENKSTIKHNEENGYKGFIKGTILKGVSRNGEHYEELAIPGITTKTISIKQVGAPLFLDIFALVGIALLLLKKGTARAVYSVIWGALGLVAFNSSYLLNMSTTPVRAIMLVIVIVVLVVSLVDSVFYIIDGRSRAAYLRSVSAAYA